MYEKLELPKATYICGVEVPRVDASYRTRASASRAAMRRRQMRQPWGWLLCITAACGNIVAPPLTPPFVLNNRPGPKIGPRKPGCEIVK